MSHCSRHHRLELAILRTVAYSDVFDYPLTAAELHRYLDSEVATPDEVASALAALAGPLVCDHDGWVALAGREDLFEVRRRRRREAERLWPAARRWAGRLARLPLVRMVAVTGALAVDNVEPAADVDFLIVTEPGRVWLARSLVIQAVRAARLDGIVLCPNWVLASDALVLDHHSLFAARELTQMVPAAGLPVYRQMRRLNPWTDRYLPNAGGPPRALERDPVDRRGGVVRAAERAMLGSIGSAVESWERRRKTREILGAASGTAEVVLDRRQCKGHVDAHGDRIHRTYADRLRVLGIEGSTTRDGSR